MKFLKAHKGSFFSLLLLALVSLQLGIGLISPTIVRADGYSPEVLAKAWNVGLALANCSDDAGWDVRQTPEDINKGGIFDGSIKDVRKVVGHLTKPDNGIVDCEEPGDVKALFDAIDEKPLDFVVDNGLYKITSDKSAYELVEIDNKPESTRINIIKGAIEKKYNINYSKGMPSDVQYAALLGTFNKKCIGSEDPGGASVKIVDEAGTLTTKTYVLAQNDTMVIPVGYSLNNDGGNDQKMTCQTIVQQMNKFAEDYKKTVAANTTDDDPTNDPPVAAPAAEQDTTSCESNSGVLGFILCPALQLVGGALNWVDTQLSRLLEIDRDKYTNSEMYDAWAQFRNIGLTLLIAAMLVMVISTALGVSFLDAYTVKKAFPRMVVAVIFMLLSWYVCIFLIDISNVVGKGTLGLMTAPFGTKAQSLTSLFTPSAGGAVLQFGGIAIVASAFAIQAAAGILFSYFATGLLVMFVAFLVLVARQMFVIVLVLLAPIAIISWIFPGNDKLWKFWWQSFSKLLLMFPIVMALIASGRIFAGVMATTPAAGAEGGLLTPLLKLTAYILPYAFIPFTFKAAGGVFGNLVGMANDRSRGAFDRLKKGRQKGMSQIAHNAKAGQFLRDRGEGTLSNRINTRAQQAAHINKAGLRPGGWKENLSTAINTSAQQDINKMMEDAEYTPIKGDDNLNAILSDWAASGSTDGKVLKQMLTDKGYARGDEATINRAVSYATRVRKRMDQHSFEQLTTSQAIAGGTVWNADEAWEKAARASHGDQAALAAMVAKGRSASMNAGRGDVGGNGFGKTFFYAQDMAAATAEYNASGKTAADKSTYEAKQKSLTDAFKGQVLESQGPGTILHPSMKEAAVQELIPAMRQRLKTAYDSGDQNQVDRELAIMSSLHDELGRTAPNKARIVADQVLNWDPTTAIDAPAVPAGMIGVAGGGDIGPTVTTTVQAQIESRRNVSNIFQGTHKEFNSAFAAQSAAAQNAAYAQPSTPQTPISGNPNPPPIGG